MKKERAATLLRKAASIMKKRGHAKMVLEDSKGRVCLIGAINTALSGSPACWTRDGDRLLTSVETFLRRKFKQPRGGFNAITWNNDPSRDGDEVIAALRGAARFVTSR